MVYCIPYFTNEMAEAGTPSVKQVWLFLDKNGTGAIHLDTPTGEDPTAAAEEFFENNELVSTGEPVYCNESDLVLSMVDIDSTPDINAFYTWSEIDPAEQPPKEAWRLFLWMQESTVDQFDAWGVNSYLKTLSLAPGINVYDVLSRICGSQM